MVKYEITTDGGSIYKIEATDDATKEEVKEFFNTQYPSINIKEMKMQETEQSYLGIFMDDSVDFIKHNPDAMIFFFIVIGVVVVLFIMRKNIFSGFKKSILLSNLQNG